MINQYIKENDLNATIEKIEDAYFEQESAKKATLNCHIPLPDFPCEIIIYINNKKVKHSST